VGRTIMIVADECTELVEQVVATAELPLENATTLPSGAYLSQEFFELERDAVLKRSWIPLAHKSQVRSAGDYMNVDLFGEPLVLVRGKDDKVRVLSRVCRHRGMDILPPGEYGRPQRGRASALLCPYHFWSYDLAGQLRGAPHMEKAQGFTRSEICLKSFRSQEWLGFVWVTFDEHIAPVNQIYGGLEERLRSWNVETMRASVELDWSCDFNWKVLVDNFMEPYHHLGAHSTTFEVFLPSTYCWTEDAQPNFMVGHLPLAEKIKQQMEAGGHGPNTLPEVPGLLARDRFEWQVYCGFPFFLILTAPDKVYWYRLIPVAPGKMELKTVMLFDESVYQMPDIEERLDREREALRSFHLEDMEVCTAIQRGVASEACRPGRLSHLEKPIWLFQRYLAQKLVESSQSVRGGSQAVTAHSL
jgi:phenylpropionate dioxygenase-like ring-hydroxylating dioxygenase large terminal subunit